MLTGEADLALPQLEPDLDCLSVSKGIGIGEGSIRSGQAAGGRERRRPLDLRVSAYARLTLVRLASKVSR